MSMTTIQEAMAQLGAPPPCGQCQALTMMNSRVIYYLEVRHLCSNFPQTGNQIAEEYKTSFHNPGTNNREIVIAVWSIAGELNLCTRIHPVAHPP